jgi:hypothetical protein
VRRDIPGSHSGLMCPMLVTELKSVQSYMLRETCVWKDFEGHHFGKWLGSVQGVIPTISHYRTTESRREPLSIFSCYYGSTRCCFFRNQRIPRLDRRVPSNSHHRLRQKRADIGVTPIGSISKLWLVSMVDPEECNCYPRSLSSPYLLALCPCDFPKDCHVSN